MKAIQLTMDEELIERLDRDPEVVARGRSAVVREAVAAYLAGRRGRAITEAYQRGYGSGAADEFTGWTSEATWPDE